MNLSGGLAIGEFTSSIIKLFALRGRGEVEQEGNRNSNAKIKRVECNHVRRTGSCVLPASRGIFRMRAIIWMRIFRRSAKLISLQLTWEA